MSHYAPQTDEEEAQMLELALALSLADAGGRPSPSARPTSTSGAGTPAARAPAQPPRSSSQPNLAAGAGRAQPYPPQPQPPPQSQQPYQPSLIYPPVAAHGVNQPASASPFPYPQPPLHHPYQPAAPAAQQYGGPSSQPPTQHAQHSQHTQHRQQAAPPAAPAHRPGPAPQAPKQAPKQSSPAVLSAGQAAGQAGQAPKRALHPDKSKCAGCGGSVWGARLTALDRVWHPHCFVCGFCSGGINDDGQSRFAIGHEDGWPYHMDCYKLKYHPVCSICQAFVPARADGRVEYKQQAFWRHTYCTSHSTDGTPQCCSCTRYQPKGVEFPQLTDGRHLCLECLGSVVVDTRDAQPLYHEVLAFFRNMGLSHPEVAPFMLVDAFTLNEYSNREGKDTAGGPVFHVRGLTLATVYRSIPSIVRSSAAGAAGGLGVSSVATDLAASGSVKCSVTAVLVMYGLPRLLTGCIMAHELMHAWLRMKHVAGLTPRVEEGLCQLMAYIWLEHQANGLTEPEQQKLASFFAYQIREDLSEVYGDGFRDAYDVFQARGHSLTSLINDVLRRGKFT